MSMLMRQKLSETKSASPSNCEGGELGRRKAFTQPKLFVLSQPRGEQGKVPF